MCLGHSLTLFGGYGPRGGSGGTHSLRGLLGHRTAWHPLLVHTGSPSPVSDENLRFRRQPTLTLPLRIDPLVRINYLFLNHGYEYYRCSGRRTSTESSRYRAKDYRQARCGCFLSHPWDISIWRRIIAAGLYIQLMSAVTISLPGNTICW